MRLLPLFLFFIPLLFYFCNKANESNISKNNESRSHNLGRNCMDCHIKKGKGEGWFTVAGTVYDSTCSIIYPNGFINLCYEKGNIKSTFARFDVDMKGNFFTTEKINMSKAFYPCVTSPSGNTIFMTSGITTGQCNSCHNHTISRIYSK
ncbi:MAG: hypothetical protein KA792_03755 [Bacteroidales bacterium]|nr:hypothetical protein [Bacteroidales bacterium]